LSIASQSEKSNLAQACDWLAEARSITVLTGAGISAESGIPTFRGPGGLWNNYRPEDLATPQAFARDPKLVWEWYDWRRQRVAAAQPNPGHTALAELESRVPSFTLITQNVDGLHRAAGSRNLIELHGNLWRLRCVSCAREMENRDAPLREIPPRCSCGGLLRPGVVWFGESLPPDAMQQAAQAAGRCDLFLLAGTSAVVYPAASLPERALAVGAKVVEINLEPTPFSNFAYLSLRGKCGEVLPRLVRATRHTEPLI
jgi:NAD-dependent protein deacetylase/lipoamidase